MVRRNGKKVVQSIIKIPTELIKLHWDAKLTIDVFWSTNTSSSWPTAQRYASLWSLTWHTMRKNISGKLSWWPITCTYAKASVSMWSLGINNFLCLIIWPQFSPPPLFWIGRLHHNIVGSSNATYAFWKRGFVCFATVFRSWRCQALWVWCTPRWAKKYCHWPHLKVIFVPFFTYDELVTSRVHPQQHKQPTNTTTMVMEPLAPRAAWIQWIYTVQVAGGLTHVCSEASVKRFW